MTAAKLRQVDAATLYSFAHQLYWEFRRLGEGSYRVRIDKTEEQKLSAALRGFPLSAAQELALKKEERRLKTEVRAGRLQEEDSPGRSGRKTLLRNLREGQNAAQRGWLGSVATQQATKQLKIPGEPEVLEALLREDLPRKVQIICTDSHNWPLPVGGILPLYLSQHAREFVAAKRDRRFPTSSRPSSRLKQIWFLSRALAGAVFGVKTRTAINLVGSKRPDQSFEESRSAKPLRKNRRKK